ncbi:MAG TPA: aminotransferase class III-fold pyridoxal phosphate-dependent enzyme [Solirubrobacterales bacterium]
MLEAFETSPPRFDPEEARGLARSLFRVSGEAHETSGERDQTFQIANGATRYVLKISNAAESEATLDFEAGLLGHLEATEPELRVPRLMKRGDLAHGAVRVRHLEDGPEHFARLFEFLDGSPGIAATGIGEEAIGELGETVAVLGLALRGFFHPGAGRELIWDLRNLPRLEQLMESVPGGSRALVAAAVERFETEVIPRWPTLPAQVVHGDLTLENVLFDDAGRVSGVIDFGDAHHGPRLLDLASALASMLRKRDGAGALLATRRFLDGYCRKAPLEPAERELLGPTLGARLAAISLIGGWYVERFPHKASYLSECVADSLRLLEELERIGAAALDRSVGVPRTSASVAELLEKRRALLGPALSDLFYEDPVHVVRGEGAWLIDSDGRRLLDAYNNVAVVGHGPPRVAVAVVDQTRRINTHTRYLYEPLFELAERLTDGLEERCGLDTVMIVNSGSEANDLTWRLATTFSGERGALVSVDAYHGMTTAVSDFSPQQWPAGYEAEHVEGFKVDPGPGGGAPPPIAAGVEAAIGRLAERGVRPAALVIEGSFTSDGIVAPEPDDVLEAVRIARAAGALIVADEVQAGHGRTGSHLWSFERYGYDPDFVTMGKPMGDGYPVAALITRSEIVSRFGEGTYYFSTFGGNPVAARAALAVLDVIEDEGLIAQVGRVGAELTQLLGELAGRHPSIREVRSHGTLVGVELGAIGDADSAAVAASTMNGLRRRGVLIGRTGPRSDVLKIRPPLVFASEHAVLFAETLDATLAELESR